MFDKIFRTFWDSFEFLDVEDSILKENLIRWKSDIPYLTDYFS